MTNKDEYMELREKIIRPIMEKLKYEYELQGYKFSISIIKPPNTSKRATRIHRGVSVFGSTFGGIYLSKRLSDKISQTISVYLSDAGSVVVKRLNALSFNSLNLDKITSELIEKEIRKVFG